MCLRESEGRRKKFILLYATLYARKPGFAASPFATVLTSASERSSSQRHTKQATQASPRRTAPKGASQTGTIWVESKQKLFDILMSKQHFMPPVVVYVASRLGAGLLSNAITVTTGVKALSIHGEKTVKERRDIMKSFLMGDVPVIVATGVLGRGLDLLAVRQVIVFDMPNSINEYVHQIGRASRLGEEGTAFVFVCQENKNLCPELVEMLRSSGAAIPRELVRSRACPFPVGRGQKKRRHD